MASSQSKVQSNGDHLLYCLNEFKQTLTPNLVTNEQYRKIFEAVCIYLQFANEFKYLAMQTTKLVKETNSSMNSALDFETRERKELESIIDTLSENLTNLKADKSLSFDSVNNLSADNSKNNDVIVKTRRYIYIYQNEIFNNLMINYTENF